jgi:energy-coupling factor transporter transmembrane protein EcfT
MLSLLHELLSKQDQTRPHSLLTRLIVSSCICLAYIVLHGFYGLIVAIVFYLLGVELIGLPQHWMFYPFILGLLIGCWKSFLNLRDYWRNFGHGKPMI